MSGARWSLSGSGVRGSELLVVVFVGCVLLLLLLLQIGQRRLHGLGGQPCEHLLVITSRQDLGQDMGFDEQPDRKCTLGL